MADIIPDFGLDLFAFWAIDTFQWLMLNSTFDPAPGGDTSTYEFVADVVAFEITSAGYVRQTVDTPLRTVDTVAHRINYTCAGIDLGIPVAGQFYQYLSCSQRVTNDADSPLVGFWDLGVTATDGTPLLPVLSTGNVVEYTDQQA